jgi:hypothetical protein
VIQPDFFGVLGNRGQEQLRCRPQTELIGPLVFHLLPAAVAEFVSQFRLFDGLDDPLMFVVVLPRPGIFH